MKQARAVSVARGNQILNEWTFGTKPARYQTVRGDRSGTPGVAGKGRACVYPRFVARECVAVRALSAAFKRVFSVGGLTYAYENAQSCERGEGGRRCCPPRKRETQRPVERAACVFWKVDYEKLCSLSSDCCSALRRRE